MKNNNMTRNLGEGNISKLLASLAIPAVVAQVVNLLYNIVDRVYIGHIPGIGANALTGSDFLLLYLCLLMHSQCSPVQEEHQGQQYLWERRTMIQLREL